MNRTLKILTAQEYTALGALPSALRLTNETDVETVDLAGVQAIELDFPKFTDGRAFSQAWTLRRRGFAGDIRATGAVLIDQLVQMQRSGFSSAVLHEGQDIAHAQRQFDRFAAFYQGDSQVRTPHFARAG
jgi:uncharacterized protein (DUF934 family)